MTIAVALWRGHVPLPKTAWLYGGLAMGVLSIPVIWLTLVRLPWFHAPMLLGFCFFYLLYAAFVAVAIWRSANKYRGRVAWRALAKASVIVVFLNMTLQLAGN